MKYGLILIAVLGAICAGLGINDFIFLRQFDDVTLFDMFAPTMLVAIGAYTICIALRLLFGGKKK